MIHDLDFILIKSKLRILSSRTVRNFDKPVKAEGKVV